MLCVSTTFHIERVYLYRHSSWIQILFDFDDCVRCKTKTLSFSLTRFVIHHLIQHSFVSINLRRFCLHLIESKLLCLKFQSHKIFKLLTIYRPYPVLKCIRKYSEIFFGYILHVRRGIYVHKVYNKIEMSGSNCSRNPTNLGRNSNRPDLINLKTDPNPNPECLINFLGTSDC